MLWLATKKSRPICWPIIWILEEPIVALYGGYIALILWGVQIWRISWKFIKKKEKSWNLQVQMAPYPENNPQRLLLMNTLLNVPSIVTPFMCVCTWFFFCTCLYKDSLLARSFSSLSLMSWREVASLWALRYLQTKTHMVRICRALEKSKLRLYLSFQSAVIPYDKTAVRSGLVYLRSKVVILSSMSSLWHSACGWGGGKMGDKREKTSKRIIDNSIWLTDCRGTNAH